MKQINVSLIFLLSMICILEISAYFPVNQMQSTLKCIENKLDLILLDLDKSNCVLTQETVSCKLQTKKQTHLLNNLKCIENKLDNILMALDEGCIKIPTLILPTSCEKIKTNFPQSSSGLYTIKDLNSGNKHEVYCNFDVLCDDNTGWMRVASLHMQNSIEACPNGFQQYNHGSIRACGTNDGVTFSGCSEPIKFSSHEVQYSKVCGRITGYQIGTMWGLWTRGDALNDINKQYLDGISLTYGSPRKHLWSFIISDYDNKVDQGACPCAVGSTQKTQAFVGDNYFCETGRTSTSSKDANAFHTDPLWNGKECRLTEAPCCNVTGIPWFNRTLPEPTTDDIEMRICDHWKGHGHPLIGSYEIYVK